MPKMPKMCYRYSQDVLKTCQGDAQDFPIMLKICPRYCRISKRSPTDSLTGPPIWKRCLRNAHPKNVFLSFVKVMKILLRENTLSEGHFISEIQRMFRDAHCSVSISLIYFCAWLWLKENDLKISTKEAKHNTLGWRWHGDCCETPKWEKEGKIQFHWLSMQEQSR